MKEKTIYDRWMKNPKFARMMYAEDLVMQASEGLLGLIDFKSVDKQRWAKVRNNDRLFSPEETDLMLKKMYEWSSDSLLLADVAEMAHELNHRVEITFKKIEEEKD